MTQSSQSHLAENDSYMHPEKANLDANIGEFMQVHMRLYVDGDLFESIVINAAEQENCSHADNVTVHHQIVDDQAEVFDRIFQVWIKVPSTDMKFVLHMPIGQSEDWEVLSLDDKHTLGFFRIAASKS